MADQIEIRVPDIGDFEDIPVIEVLVEVGERVSAEQSIITLESDKATMEVPAPADGVVASLDVSLDDTVSEGDLVGVLTTEGEAGEVADEAPESTEASSVSESQTEPDVESAPGSSAAPTPSAPSGEAPGEARSLEVRVPDIGDFEGVPVIEVLVSAGDVVEAEQSLVTLESDKATMEVPAPASGTVETLAVAVDDTVSEGDLVATLTVKGEASAKEDQGPAKSEAESQESGSSADPSPKTNDAQASPAAKPGAKADASAGKRQAPPVPLGAERLMPGKVPYASPAIRAFARELGVDLLRVKGSGRGGRIVRDDVTAFIKSALQGGAAPAAGGFEVAPPPKVDFSKFGETETVALSRIKKISGKNLHRNWVTIPHVTHNDLADSTEMESFRQRTKGAAKAQGFNLTPLAFIMKSVVAALKEYPNFNASLDAGGEALVLKKYYHLGIAVDTPDGLVVPVIRDCDQKSVLELARELGEVSQRARDGKLTPADWQGASFSISSLGGIGGTSFSPIINAPEVAILGVSRARMEPVWDGEQFQPRLMLPLSLSYDHRVIDGAQAARFCRALAAHVEDQANLVL